MKNLIFSALVLLVVKTPLFAIEPNHSGIKVVDNEKSFILNVTDAKYMTITDHNGDIFFSDRIENNKQKIKYNLNQLPNNNYTITIHGENTIKTHQAVVTDNIIDINATETYFCPTLRVLDKKVIVNAYALASKEVSLLIYNDADEIVYSFTEHDSGEFKKVFNLEQLDPGQYKVVVSTDHFIRRTNVSI